MGLGLFNNDTCPSGHISRPTHFSDILCNSVVFFNYVVIWILWFVGFNVPYLTFIDLSDQVEESSLLQLIHVWFDFILIVSSIWRNNFILLLMLVATKVLLLLVISLTDEYKPGTHNSYGFLYKLNGPGRCGSNSKRIIFKLIVLNNSLDICCEIASRWMPRKFINDKSTLLQVMAWPEPMLTQMYVTIWHH